MSKSRARAVVPRRDDDLAEVLREAERLLGVVVGKTVREVGLVDDVTYKRLVELGAKSLAMKAIGKAHAAIDAIDTAKLAETSPVAAATVVGILVDKVAGPLRALTHEEGDDDGPFNLEFVRDLMDSVRGNVKVLEASGIKLRFETGPPRSAVAAEVHTMEPYPAAGGAGTNET